MHNASWLRRTMAIGFLAILSNATISPVTAAAATNTSAALQVPVVGVTNSGGTFAGTATLTSFMANGQTVAATGTISGLINGTQSVIALFSAPVTLPSTGAAAAVQPTAACQTLNVVLGPINLNVLGAIISIPNPIVLNITAVQGSASVLGNSLCNAAALLSSSGDSQQIANSLNQLLGTLNGL